MERIASGERILLTLWVGGMWAIGYMAVPTLFHALDDRQLAGALAGEMFTIIHYVGLVSGVLLLAGSVIRLGGGQAWRGWRTWVIATMVLLVVVGLFVLQPMMQELKAQGLAEGSDAAARFGQLHGVSSFLYLVTSLLGLVLVVFGLRKEPD